CSLLSLPLHEIPWKTRPMPHPRPRPLAVLLGLTVTASLPAFADTPLGWISRDLVHAYTQGAGDVEVTAEALAVNDTIDFLDVRDDLIAGNRRLVDDSGDLQGWQGTLRVGLLDVLEAFYRRQEHDLTLKLGPIASLGLVDLDQELHTTSQEGGLKWTFYQAGFGNPNSEIPAASLELAWLDNCSDDLSLHSDSIPVLQ